MISLRMKDSELYKLVFRKRIHDKEKCYAEAQRLIKVCGEKGKKTLDLSNLADLDAIPQEIEGLHNLTTLIIESDKLTKIPDFLGNLVSLKNININLQALGKDKPGYDIILPETFQNLVNLQKLSISGNIKELPQWIGNFEKLISLYVKSKHIQKFPHEVGRLKRLQNLALWCREITELPDQIAECPLVTMSLGCSKLTSLPESFRNLKRLQSFLYQFDSIAELPELIWSWESLSYLDLTMPIIEKIPENISNLKRLAYFNISKISIKKIPDYFMMLPLEYLSLKGTFESIPPSVGNLPNLKELYLSSPNLKSLPDSFEQLHSLRKLTVDAKSIKSLPTSLGGCSNLESISIKSDCLTKLPTTFSKLEKLQQIYLD
ncbi:MAG: hypothetical protein FWG20_07065, partial [Candidatus Cloacimonetes bacterium]|nr:hypothetical protein [Candidatus Cloacimonadota bacterium]